MRVAEGHQNATNGSTICTRAFSKSERLCVATTRVCVRAVAATRLFLTGIALPDAQRLAMSSAHFRPVFGFPRDSRFVRCASCRRRSTSPSGCVRATSARSKNVDERLVARPSLSVAGEQRPTKRAGRRHIRARLAGHSRAGLRRAADADARRCPTMNITRPLRVVRRPPH